MVGRRGHDHGRRLTNAEVVRLSRLLREGQSQFDVAQAIPCDAKTVLRWVFRLGGLEPYERRRSPLRLSLEERESIAVGVARGDSASAIARQLGRSPSTITRELSANGGRRNYRASRADARALDLARRPKVAKLARCPRLRAEVERRLETRWSPQQIAARLQVDFPDDPEMRVSHETIYQSLFVQSRGALRRELTKALRTGRARRRARGAMRQGARTDLVLIAERPAEVDDRSVPGHWEGDLIAGKGNRSAIGTLVERTSRFTMLFQLPAGKDADAVRAALTEVFPSLPAALRRTLTWDRGSEMADHARFTIDTGVQVYFCDPQSPWQRGTNENTNSLLRQYLPKGADLSVHSQADLDAIADELNGRPRQTLGWMTPSERFDQLVAMTG